MSTSEKGNPPLHKPPPRGAGFLWIFFSQGKVGRGRTYVKWQCWHCCSWDLFSEPKLRCDCTIMAAGRSLFQQTQFCSCRPVRIWKKLWTPPVEEPFNSCFISSSPGAPLENEQCALLATKLLGTSPEGRALWRQDSWHIRTNFLLSSFRWLRLFLCTARPPHKKIYCCCARALRSCANSG